MFEDLLPQHMIDDLFPEVWRQVGNHTLVIHLLTDLNRYIYIYCLSFVLVYYYELQKDNIRFRDGNKKVVSSHHAKESTLWISVFQSRGTLLW